MRHKVAELIALVTDEVRLKDERAKAKANRDKYKGVSNDDVSHGKSKYAETRKHSLISICVHRSLCLDLALDISSLNISLFLSYQSIDLS